MRLNYFGQKVIKIAVKKMGNKSVAKTT
jgi:hypothetical protein